MKSTEFHLPPINAGELNRYLAEFKCFLSLSVIPQLSLFSKPLVGWTGFLPFIQSYKISKLCLYGPVLVKFNSIQSSRRASVLLCDGTFESIQLLLQTHTVLRTRRIPCKIKISHGKRKKKYGRFLALKKWHTTFKKVHSCGKNKMQHFKG